MHITVGSVVLLLVLNVEAQQQIYQRHHSEGFGERIGQEEPATPVEYNYSYDVRDELTGDWKSQEETRSGDRVRGRYSLLDADGSTRTVEYSVDSHSGFNAVVRRDGDQISVPNPNVRTIAETVNEYQSRRPTQTPTIYRHEDKNSRSALPNTRTRLAQDARTGNVVDVQSGFGAFSQITNAQPTTRIEPTHRASFGRTILNQDRFEVPTQTVQRGQQEIQEVYARSQYQTSHPSHSTSPIHFPVYVASAYNPRIIQELRRPERPFPVEVDVRRPTALLPNSNMPDNNRQNDGDTSNNNFAPDTNSYNTNEVYPQNIEYPIQQEEVRGSTTPAPMQGSFGPTPQYGFESNHTRSPLFRHLENVFGARINGNNRRIHQSNSESISYQDDTIVTDAQELSPAGPSNSYPENFRQVEINAPSPTQVYQDFSATNGQGNTDSRIGAQRFLYPANTVPLEDNTPAHFFTRGSLSHGESSLIHLDDNSHLRVAPVFHVPRTPVHYSTPITHDGHTYGK